jgi:hypothetical protein
MCVLERAKRAIKSERERERESERETIKSVEGVEWKTI